MKVTSFEISKKLAEIGFNPEEDDSTGHCFWCRMPSSEVELFDYSGINNFTRGFEELCRAYDLETILEALPKTIIANIDIGGGLEDCKDYLQLCYCAKTIGYPLSKLEIEIEENESLADTAARLLIKLYKAGLVKFEQLTNKKG